MPSDTSRTRCSDAVAEALVGLDDERLRSLVEAAQPLAVGIGGATSRALVAGVPVFIKRVTLTDVERERGNVRSTAELHGLPVQFHYGVGSVGASAWRELEAHLLADRWVRTAQCEAFPLLHHWRVLDGRLDRDRSSAEHDDLDGTVDYWHGSPAVRRRLTALAEASAGLHLFLEHVPQTLAQWLSTTLAHGPDALDAVCDQVAEELVSTASFMARQGFGHFDAHFRNILTDGERLCFSDFGLALSSTFSTAAHEERFLREHADHDVAYVVRELVNWLVTAFAPDAASWTDASRRDELVRRFAAGRAPLELPTRAAALVHRYAQVTVVMNDFYARLYGTDRFSTIPVSELRSACAAAGLGRDPTS